MAAQPRAAHAAAVSIRVALAGRHDLYRSHVAAALSRQPGFVLVLQAAGARQAAEAIAALPPADQPQALLLDMDPPGREGLAGLRTLAQRHPALRIVAVSLHEDAPLREAAVRAGAAAWIGKDRPWQELLEALRGSRI